VSKHRSPLTFSISFITANCKPLGNILIIQNEKNAVSDPNDSAFGGCVVFNFTHPVVLINFGLLDTERIVNITVSPMQHGQTGMDFLDKMSYKLLLLLLLCFGSLLQATNSDIVSTSFPSPRGVGNNGHWIANKTMSLDEFVDVKVLEFCFVDSGAVTFLHYHDIGCPTSSPSARPTFSPTVSPTALPTVAPSSRPTPNPTTSSPTPCPLKNTICDFSTLWPGVALSNATQAQRLLDDCSMSVTAINTIQNNLVNVFNSSHILGTRPQFDPDLGSPNNQCPGGGPGRGVGGWPNASFRK
jgi:hypothetical protein